MNDLFAGFAKPYFKKNRYAVLDTRLGDELTGPVLTARLPELQVPTIEVALCARSYSMSWEYTAGKRHASTREMRGVKIMISKSRFV